MSDEMSDVQTQKEPMNDKDLNTDKILIYVGEEIEQPSYKCPYPEAAVLLENTRSLRSAGNMEWVEQAARYYDLYSHWLMCENGYEVENSKTAHKLYSWMCDGSQYLQAFFPDAIDEKRKDMERRIDGLRNRASALRIIEDKQTISFIENMVYRLKASNYVIFPVRRAETLFYFLSYDHTLLKQELPLVAEALSLLKTNGLADSYVNVRIQSLLKQEIDQYEEIIAGLWFTEARQILELKITEAAGIIALALLNSDDPAAEGLNVPMLSARLCRYLSRLDTSLSAQLKNKAYTLLTGETTMEGRLGWEDVVNFDLNHLMSRLVNIHIEELGLSDRQPGDDRWMQYSNGRNTLTLDHDGFTLSPLFPGKSGSWRGRREKASLMDNRVFVALFGKPACLFADCTDMAALRFYWHQLQEDFPLYLPADTLAEEEKQKGQKPEEEEKDWPKAGENIKIGIVGLSADRQYLEGIVLDLAWRGERAILPLTQINECYYLIPGFERHFQENTTYRVKVLERNREGIRVSLARSYNEFIYEENTQRKTLPAMYAGCEGGKTRWLLVTGSTCLTSSSRWVKPKIGEICQVEVKYADSHLLKPVVTAGKVKASVSKEEFMEELHRHLQEFSDYCSGIHTQKMEEEAEIQILKKRNNPFANALQKVDWASLVTVTTADNDAAAGQEPETPFAGDGGKEDNAAGRESTCRGWLDAQAAVELLFCLDQLAKDLEVPEDRFNACNFLRMLCLFAGRRDNATYYELCADYLYAIHQMGTQPVGERLSPVNMERFGILLARMEQLGIKPYGITFEQCRNVINVLCSVADGDTVQLQRMVKSEDRTVAELARYFSMLPLLTERDTELQAIVFRNVNTLLGIREPGDKGAPVIPVCFGFEGVEREFKTSAFVHAGKEREEQSVVLARVIASFMNTDGGTLYIGVNDLGYLNGIREDLKFVHNDCDVYLRTVNRNIICLLGGGKEDYNRYQEYIRCDFHEYGPGRMVLAFRVPPVGEVVKLQNGKVYTRSGSSCICKPEENVDEFAALRRTLKLDSTPRKPEFPTFFSEERNEYIFMEQQPPQAEVTPAAEGASATGQVPGTGEMASLPLFRALDADTPPAVQEVEDSSSSVKKKSAVVKKEKGVLNVFTSTLRPNPLQKKVELGYNSNYAFVSLFQDGKIACSPSPKIGVWGGKGGKVLFSYDQEGTEELLVSVFTTGEVGISNLKKGFSAPNTPVAFVKNINDLLFCSPASKDKYLLLIAVKNEDKRYRIIRLSDFDKSMSVQPRLTLTLVPDKGEYIFAEILDEEMMKNIDDEKVALDSFDEYNAGRIWEHTSYKNGLKQISEMCKLPY